MVLRSSVGSDREGLTPCAVPGKECAECYKSVMARDPAPDSYVTLKIPRPLYERLKQVIQESGFHSVTEFAVYVLRDLASHHHPGGTPLRKGPPDSAEPLADVDPLSPDEIEAIRQRLGSLGYL